MMSSFLFLPSRKFTPLADAARVKAAAVAGGEPTHWRADLWADTEAAIAFANEPPLAGPGAIVFNQRDNGQVCTFYLTGSQVWRIDGTTFGQNFEARAGYVMTDFP